MDDPKEFRRQNGNISPTNYKLLGNQLIFRCVELKFINVS